MNDYGAWNFQSIDRLDRQRERYDRSGLKALLHEQALRRLDDDDRLRERADRLHHLLQTADFWKSYVLNPELLRFEPATVEHYDDAVARQLGYEAQLLSYGPIDSAVRNRTARLSDLSES